MNADERRTKILEILRSEKKAVSGNILAQRLNVSRQVIVQDIAILRAENTVIVSTPSGYKLPEADSFKRVFKCRHTDEETREELNLIVDMGGKVIDVFVNHRIYGTVRADLMIKSRKDVNKFMENLESGKSTPLKNITAGYHYHTIEADSDEDLNAIELALKEHNFIAEKRY